MRKLEESTFQVKFWDSCTDTKSFLSNSVGVLSIFLLLYILLSVSTRRVKKNVRI